MPTAPAPARPSGASAPDATRAPVLALRPEVVLGTAFWAVAGVAAAARGEATTWATFATPAALLVAAAWRLARLPPRRGWVLDWLPIPFVVLTYEMLHTVVPACGGWTIDGTLRDADRLVFGDDVATLLRPLQTPPLTALMAAFYAGYYVLPFSLAVWWYARGRRRAFRELAAGIMGALFVGYLGYLFLPAVGPHAWLDTSVLGPPLEGDFIGPVIASLNGAHAGAFPRDAFPSLHTTNALTVLLVARRHDRRAFALYLVPMLGLVAATLYLRFHWAVDVAAGIALALAWQPVAERLVAREAAAIG